VDSSKNGALLNESRELNGMNSGKPKVVATTKFVTIMATLSQAYGTPQEGAETT
tara:strand:- start:353 stop:514 length:162 start_codon:yes stop_codon:yes gene_type:complete